MYVCMYESSVNMHVLFTLKFSWMCVLFCVYVLLVCVCLCVCTALGSPH